MSTRKEGVRLECRWCTVLPAGRRTALKTVGELKWPQKTLGFVTETQSKTNQANILNCCMTADTGTTLFEYSIEDLQLEFIFDFRENPKTM